MLTKFEGEGKKMGAQKKKIRNPPHIKVAKPPQFIAT